MFRHSSFDTLQPFPMCRTGPKNPLGPKELSNLFWSWLNDRLLVGLFFWFSKLTISQVHRVLVRLCKTPNPQAAAPRICERSSRANLQLGA